MASAVPPAAVAGDADFAAALYGRVAGATAGNVFLSPASVRMALAMTATGAVGSTARQMSDALSLPQCTADQLAAEFKAAIPAPTPDVQLTIANGLWLQRGVPFRPQFVTRLAADFGASAESVDFRAAPDPSRKRVNEWVDRETHHHIGELLGPGSVTSATRLVLANAVYFKGDWQSPFTAGATRPTPFHLDGSHDVDVPMMRHATGLSSVYQDDMVDAVELPYKGATTAMLVVIPKAVDGLAAIGKGLTGATLTRWSAGLRPTEANLLLPRFKATGSYHLRDALISLGMADAFDPQRADFSAMTAPGPDQERVCITGVVHKSFVAVDETGTEAAAATGVTVGAMAMRAGPVLHLVADRPFLYLIRDTRTGTILFVGRCADPRT
jgi:serpin B